MRAAETFLSLIALLLVTAAALRIPRRDSHTVLLAVLFTQIAFTLGPWLARQRLEQSDPRYVVFCIVLGVIAIGAACFFVLVAVWPLFGPWAFAIPLLMPTAAGVASHQYRDLPSRFLGMMGFSMTVCGILVLLSLVVPSASSWDAARKALAAFWICEGLFHWFLPYAVKLDYWTWARRSQWVPALIAIISFTWLAWTLNSGQKELSRQAVAIPVLEVSR